MGENTSFGKKAFFFFQPEALVMEVVIVLVPCKEENQNATTPGHVSIYAVFTGS